MKWTLWVALGSFFGAMSVVIGAFGAHALKARLEQNALEWIDIGVRYQMFHALAIIAVGLISLRVDNLGVMSAGWLFAVGTVLFSGSLYLMALTELRVGIVTPIGGACLLVGWLVLMVSMLRI